MLIRTAPASRPDFCLGGLPAEADPPCLGLDLGFCDYQESLQIQAQIVSRRKANAIPDCLLSVDYPHIITLGRAGKREHLLARPEELEDRGVRFYLTGRGGDITYHGPGQLVAYPVVDLKEWSRDIGLYLRTLERCLIGTLQDFGIFPDRLSGATGVWVGGQKIAAIGVRCSQWVTSHGLALNVNTDLEYFKLIVPCGLRGKEVTSMAALLGHPVGLGEVRSSFTGHFARVFGRALRVTDWDQGFKESCSRWA